MELTTDVLSLLLIGAGAYTGYRARQRKFNRTNEFGVERFGTYKSKLRAKSSDYLLLGASALLVVAGTLLLASGHFDTWGWIVMAPVCLFMLYLLIGN